LDYAQTGLIAAVFFFKVSYQFPVVENLGPSRFLHHKYLILLARRQLKSNF
jgi:hypothetical protein